ncbi:ankyrin repeat domain-containing protein [Dactylosporangium sp. CA-139066]|uniref:ankyrin repeat domain-containing protein n=1 Tax=Dactylosporangium sp. CA-139066 TaxID=3239930 RepID=UPI003D8F01F4
MSALVPPAALGAWRRVRRHAVPPAMIAAATEARLAGGWRAACAEAGVRIEASPAQLARFADDLQFLAPDLVRWHLPRNVARGDTTLSPRRRVVLVQRGDAALVMQTPRVGPGPQLLTLVVLDSLDDGRFAVEDWTHRRYLWDARRTGELAGAVSGPRALEMLRLQDAGRVLEAWAAAGVEIPPPSEEAGDRHALFRNRQLLFSFVRLDADPSCLLAAARERGGPTASFDVSHYGELRVHDLQTDRPFGEWTKAMGYNGSRPPDRVPVAEYLRPIDLHLLRFGVLSPAQLHPLVGPVLAPFWSGSSYAGADPWDGPVRVRCRGEWHELGWSGGRLTVPHSDDERRREETLLALGGQLQGCFAAAQAWRDRSARLPRRLEEQRRDLMLRAQHGDLAGVLRLLDAGVDPLARDPHGRTLLHFLPELLSRLLAAGLDVDARDRRGRTALHTAIHGNASVALVRSLIDAGARTDVADDIGDTLVDDYRRHRPDLALLDPLRP